MYMGRAPHCLGDYERAVGLFGEVVEALGVERESEHLGLPVLPVVFAVGGIAFPIGVLLYWTTSNLWTMGQQFYVIRNNPTPGTPAFEAKKKRDAERHHGGAGTDAASSATATATEVEEAPKPPPRAQPKKQSRKKRKGKS